MVSFAINIVDRAFNISEKSITFLRRLVIGLVIAGVVFGIVGLYISRLLWLVEVLIVPTLLKAITNYSSISKDNVGLLNGANRTLKGARRQAQIEHMIKKEKNND